MASNRAQTADGSKGGAAVVVVVLAGGAVVEVEVVDDVVDEVVDEVEVVDVLDVVDELDGLDGIVEVEVLDEGVPSVAGCQFGSVSAAGTSLGTGVIPVPSGFIVNRSGPFGAPRSCELEEKTIFVPSGDHAGSVPVLTSRIWPLPSAFMSQISAAPLA